MGQFCAWSSKTVLGLISILFTVASVCLIGIGIYVLATFHRFDDFVAAKFTMVPATVIISTGVIFLLASCLGCYSLCKDNKCMLCLFGTFVLLLMTLLLTAAICAALYRADIEGSVKNRTTTVVDEYNTTSQTTRDEIDYIQSQLHCCGAINYTDYFSVLGYNTVPRSCCLSTNATECDGHLLPRFDVKHLIYTEGCYEKLSSFFINNLKYIAGAAAGFLVLLILGFVCTCALMCYNRKEVPYYNLGGSTT